MTLDSKETAVNSNLDVAVRSLFKSSPFNKLISEGMTSMFGNSNGTVFGQPLHGDQICLDESGKILEHGKSLLEAVLGSCTQENSSLKMDVKVNDVGFCLSLMGPPSSLGTNWVVTRRANISFEEAKLPYSIHVDLADNSLSSIILDFDEVVDLGKADTHLEGAYRRGYHQAVSEVALALQRQSLSANDLLDWVEGSGMRWRKDATLERQFKAPKLGKEVISTAPEK